MVGRVTGHAPEGWMGGSTTLKRVPRDSARTRQARVGRMMKTMRCGTPEEQGARRRTGARTTGAGRTRTERSSVCLLGD